MELFPRIIHWGHQFCFISKKSLLHKCKGWKINSWRVSILPRGALGDGKVTWLWETAWSVNTHGFPEGALVMQCHVLCYIIPAPCEHVMTMAKVKENRSVSKSIMAMKSDRLYDRCNFSWHHLGITNWWQSYVHTGTFPWGMCANMSPHLDAGHAGILRHKDLLKPEAQQLCSMNTVGAPQSDERPKLPQTVNTDLFHYNTR